MRITLEKIETALARIAGAAAVMLAATVFALPAGAQIYPYNSTQATHACPVSGSGVTCFGGQLFRSTDQTCQNDPRPGTNATQQFNCSSVAFQCNTTAFPCGGCTAATSTAGASCTSPIGGQYSNQCGSCGCPANTTLCSASNTCVANVSCPAGQTFDACAGGCVGNLLVYLQSSPTAQGSTGAANAAIAVNGNLKLDGAGASQGDIFMANGKAIRADGAGATSLNLGNWGAGATGFNLGVFGSVGVGTNPTAARMTFANFVGSAPLDNYNEFQEIWYNSGSPGGSYGVGIRPNTVVFNSGAGAYSFDRGGNATTMYMSTAGNVGIGTTSPFANIPLTLYSGSASDANKATIVLDGTVSVNNSFGGVRMKHNVFTTGWGSDVLAYDAGSFGTNLVFRVTPTGSTNASTPVERMRLDNRGYLGLGLNTATPGYSIDAASNSGAAIARLSDMSAGGNLWTGLRLDRTYGTERWFFGMNGTDSDFVIQQKDGAGVTTERFSVNYATGAVNINGFTIDANGTPVPPVGGASMECSSGAVVGATVGSVNGDPTGPAAEQGYNAVNALCNAAVAGSHACTAGEVLRSISCGKTASFPASGSFWVANGPPGFTSPMANDCGGFTDANPSTSTTQYGAVWAFDSAANGFGKGLASTCDASRRILCCK